MRVVLKQPINTRLGLGADIRVNEQLSLSPMVTLGSGFLENLEWQFADRSTQDAVGPLSQATQHTMFAFQLGAHFDLLGSKR